jgi:cell division protein FtsB
VKGRHARLPIPSARPWLPALVALAIGCGGLTVSLSSSAAKAEAGEDTTARLERLREAIEKERAALEAERASREEIVRELERLREELEGRRTRIDQLEREVERKKRQKEDSAD